MKFSDFQNEQLDIALLSTLKGGIRSDSPTVGCESHVCESAAESIANGMCTTAACSSRAA